ncbi:MAG: arsenosugar biosynthesis radical SAM protein ArsS [Deltaproteobacteria bacterium]|nr:arsenosugar biosynthesis radical SAM protein ArsS [Deltaproteobacteria bacterium]
MEPFSQTLARHSLRLSREETTTLQINVGLLCNQACRHCHLEAGPDRREIMPWKTAQDVVAYAERSGFEVVDITGGAPELNPNIHELIEGLSPLTPRLMFRSNLLARNNENREGLLHLLRDRGVVIVASFPSLNESQTDSQRGEGVFSRSVRALQRLNKMGYGNKETGLELDLVSNPTGAFLPESQKETERRFRQVLEKRWGIVFNNLYSFANVPLGRFRKWLSDSGNLDAYIEKLSSGFNPCAIEGLMCKTLVSVSWDGYLYDCDFNLARGLYLGNTRIHVSEMPGPPEPGSPIAVADHCYTCTAGAGFT